MTIQNFATPSIVNYCYSSWVILFDMKLFTHSEWQMEDRPEMLSSEIWKINSPMPYWYQCNY